MAETRTWPDHAVAEVDGGGADRPDGLREQDAIGYALGRGPDALAAVGTRLASLGTSASHDPRVYYVGGDGHVHELAWVTLPFLGSRWYRSDLTRTTGAPPPAGLRSLAVTGTTTELFPRLYQLAADGHVWELGSNNGTDWFAKDLMGDTGAPPAAAGSTLAAHGWLPSREPRVYYFTDDDQLHELAWNAPRWQHSPLTGSTQFPLAANRVSLAVTGTTTDLHPRVYYVADDGHAHELASNGGDWFIRDLTAETGAPPPAPESAFAAHGGLPTREPRLYYFDSDNHVHELAWNAPNWGDTDLTGQYGFAAPSTRDALAVTGTTDTFFPRLYHVAGGGHVVELGSNGGGWWQRDVSAETDATSVAGPSPVAAMGTAPTFEPRVHYVSADGHVRELGWANPWYQRDITAEIPALLPAPVRRNLATVSPEERARLLRAILALRDRFAVPEDPVNLWFKQDQIHQATHVHEQASFIPWHRELVNRFEAALQEVDPDVALHYWDWTTDPRHTPDGHGGFVNLLTPDFMGAADGVLGPPLERCYDQSLAPGTARDERGPGDPYPADNPAHPPRTVTRKLVTSSRTPANARLIDYDLSQYPPGTGPTEDGQVQVRSDGDILGQGLDGDMPGQFERFWRAINPSHGWAHAYFGGDMGEVPNVSPAHKAFRDPFVFLLHSNLDRLWASWQLSGAGFDQRQWSPRLDPSTVYGRLAEGLGDFPDADDDAERVYLRADAQRELTSTMKPWNGTAEFGATAVLPWSIPGKAEPRTPMDPDVVRPPLYDRYVGDRLCMSWAALRLGHPLTGGDVIQATVQFEAVSTDNVEFVLESGPGIDLWKGLRVPDGSGASWLIETEGNKKLDRVSLWAGQVHNGQQLIFHHWDSGVLGMGSGKRIVYRLGDLGWLPPGCRVTFTWLAD